MTNPWNLTKREAEVMAAMVVNGGLGKAVAVDMGISSKTVDTLYGRAAEKIGGRTRTQALLEWDRWSRGAQGEVVACPQCSGTGRLYREAA
jgi:FixJ family two-component response regulator